MRVSRFHSVAAALDGVLTMSSASGQTPPDAALRLGDAVRLQPLDGLRSKRRMRGSAGAKPAPLWPPHSRIR